jgi:hypothetical protein
MVVFDAPFDGASVICPTAFKATENRFALAGGTVENYSILRRIPRRECTTRVIVPLRGIVLPNRIHLD